MQYSTALCNFSQNHTTCAIAGNVVQHYATLRSFVQHWMRKSIQNWSKERLQDTQNRCKFGTGSLLGRPLSANSLPKASQERLGTSPVRPRTAESCLSKPKKSTWECSGSRQDAENRCRILSGRQHNRFFTRNSFAKQCRSEFSTISVDFGLIHQVCEPLKVLRLPAKTKVRPFVLRVRSRTHCNLEKQRKSISTCQFSDNFQQSGPLFWTILHKFGRSRSPTHAFDPNFGRVRGLDRISVNFHRNSTILHQAKKPKS